MYFPNLNSEADVAALRKALETGYSTGPGVGAGALRPQSLDGVLHAVQFQAHHLKMWRRIPKSNAFSTVEEYNTVLDYGSADILPFIGESEAPAEDSSQFQRSNVQMKFVGQMASVSHIATIVQSAHDDIVALENKSRTLSLLQGVESMLFKGNSGLSSKQWDGLDSLIDPSSVIDLEGSALSEADIEEAANMIQEGFGTPTDLFCHVSTMADFHKQLTSRFRVGMPLPGDNQAGASFNSMLTQGGLVQFNASPLIGNPTPLKTVANGPTAPATPASITAAAASGTAGNHEKGAPAGTTYFAYRVVAVNDMGYSAPTAVMGSAVALTPAAKAAHNGVPLTITNPGAMGSFVPKYFRIYRSAASLSSAVPTAAADYSLIAEVPAASVVASGTTTFTDNNLILPHTRSAYVGEVMPEVISFRQLLPLTKIDLAVVGPTFKWMILLYGAPLLFAPKKWVRLINIGRLAVR